MLSANDPGTGANYQRVRDVLRQDIIAGVFHPGERLKIAALTERYDIGANPIREALQQLQGEGLVEMVPNKGAMVRMLDEAMLRETLEMREVIESFLARKFAQTGSYKLLDEIKTIQTEFEQAVAENRTEKYTPCNSAFHDVIMKAAGNREAEAFLTRASMLTRTIRGVIGYGHQRLREILAEHRALIVAFEARDVALAGQIAEEHARHASTDLIAQYHAVMEARSTTRQSSGGRRGAVPKGWSPDLSRNRS